MLRRLLEREQHEVFEAEDGASAIAAVRTNPPDLVLLDFSMPDMDGAQCLHLMQQEGYGGAVLVCTGHATEELSQQMLDRGATSILTKPFSMVELREALNKVLARAQ